MFPRYRSRVQTAVAALACVFVLVDLLVVTLVFLFPSAPTARRSLLITIFVASLLISLFCLVLLLRWLLLPYRQLVGEAERAPIAARPGHARNEAEFVLETFQSVIAQLQSQQRELEVLSARASARADSAERFSDRIVASVPSGLIAFDSEQRATIVNAPAHQLIEADGNALGKDVRTLLLGAPDLAEMVLGCLQTGRVYRREEIVTTGSQGQSKRLGATVAPIDSPADPKGRGALCLLTDITEVTKLREQVALKRNLESLGEMSAGLAHEFKNALATLHGYAQLLLTLDLDERGRAASSALLNEVRGLSEMITAFLNFARPRPLELSNLILNELFRDCGAELQSLYDGNHVELIVEGELPEIRGDQRMLRRALLNILRNAAEAIDSEKAERCVRVLGTKEIDSSGDSWIRMDVRDTGEGIPVADLHRIFIPFFTTKSTGNGIGLALAHRVITDHGGTLAANNAPEGGAVFTIRLPLA
jgi:nitrogen fixation/metabolism regulation signal transduction histidine kinase